MDQVCTGYVCTVALVDLATCVMLCLEPCLNGLKCDQVNGFQNRVLFREACEQLPKDITILEIGPHSILKSLIKQCRPDLAYVPTLKKASSLGKF